MNKRNKLKKGIIKVTYFDKDCNCEYSVPELKKVSNNLIVKKLNINLTYS